jgi:hypothetical protein
MKINRTYDLIMGDCVEAAKVLDVQTPSFLQKVYDVNYKLSGMLKIFMDQCAAMGGKIKNYY